MVTVRYVSGADALEGPLNSEHLRGILDGPNTVLDVILRHKAHLGLTPDWWTCWPKVGEGGGGG